MMKRAFKPLLLSLILSLIPTEAGAQKTLGVGLFAPEVPSPGPAQRFAFVRQVAQHLSSALGVPVTGKAYNHARDFERDVKGRKIQFAIVGAVYMASKKARILATARTSGGGTWAIMGKTKAPLASMKGKSLQLPNLGPITQSLLQHGLLAGLDAKQLFSIRIAPDINSAVTAVRVGAADAVFAPTTTKGLVKLSRPINVPPPAFVALDRRLSAANVSKATQAIVSFGASFTTIVGWQSAKPQSYRSLAAKSKKRILKMSLASSRAERLRLDKLFGPDKISFRIPELEEMYAIP